MIDYSRSVSEYARHRHAHPDVLRNLLMVSGVGRVSAVLEVGCGTGNYIVALESVARCPCWGIDPSAAMLSRARERSDNIIFQPGEAERLDFPTGSFDLVFSVDVVHHIKNRVQYFSEAHRVLKSGGRVCTVTDSEWIIRHRQPLAAYFPETVAVDLERYPRVAELRATMSRVGFEEIVENVVELSYQLTDIQAYRDKAFSCLRLIPEEAFRTGIAQMEQALRSGPIPCVSRYLLLWGAKSRACADPPPCPHSQPVVPDVDRPAACASAAAPSTGAPPPR